MYWFLRTKGHLVKYW